ncbi:MAG TPA: YifB family Mg chelatase-like AAA ATPase [Alphaproteobacteria bacterium]|nr:YifB family Mg chelatase-like AAA ATPase [Alphaproteobacteria bacterium]
MLSSVQTVAFQGIETCRVTVQVQISNGLPAFTIVGLADKAVAESRERIRASFQSIGLTLPAKRITVNLAPADLQKEGSHYDLPVAMGLLSSMGIIPEDLLSEYLILGELGLDASIAPVSGVLSAAIFANLHSKGLICPKKCAKEASWSGNQAILAPPYLLDLIQHFKDQKIITPLLPYEGTSALAQEDDTAQEILDIKDIKGQLFAKRALEIAASGGHNMLLIGPPGSGKSMLASRLSSILPPLSAQEALEVTVIHSHAGELPDGGLVTKRPYRDPHYGASTPALVGGGSKAKPGELSLAHHGVLFLDEMPEFARTTLESLRQPLESHQITIARANAHVTYPAKIQLIAAMNPCKCGYFGTSSKECSRSPLCAQDYQAKISGPLLDRMDLFVDMPEVTFQDMTSSDNGCTQTSETVKKRVHTTRLIQEKRSLEQTGAVVLNAHARGDYLKTITTLDEACHKVMAQAFDRLGLSARGYHRILRVARTLADMEEVPTIEVGHLTEALQFRGGA